MPTRRHRATPSRSAAVASRCTHQMIGGTSHWAVMCRCPLDCDIIPGANAVNPAPIAAPTRCSPNVRRSSAYQAMPVPARLPTIATAKLTGAPNASVTGASRMPSRISEALLSRFTPSGAFNRWLSRWKSPA